MSTEIILKSTEALISLLQQKLYPNIFESSHKIGFVNDPKNRNNVIVGIHMYDFEEYLENGRVNIKFMISLKPHAYNCHVGRPVYVLELLEEVIKVFRSASFEKYIFQKPGERPRNNYLKRVKLNLSDQKKIKARYSLTCEPVLFMMWKAFLVQWI